MSEANEIDVLVRRHASELVDQVMPLIRNILEQQMAAIIEEVRKDVRQFRKLEAHECVLCDPHCDCAVGEYCRRLPDA